MNIEELYKAIAPRLTNWLVATSSPYAEACDIVQDVFLKLWSMKDCLRDDVASVSGLAFTIARNRRKNLARDNARLAFVGEIRDPEGDGEGTPAQAPGNIAPQAAAQAAATSATDAEYLRRRLADAFGKLPPVLREAYTLFQIGELPVREIASQTGVSENLVKVRIFRAKEKLREILADLRVT